MKMSKVRRKSRSIPARQDSETHGAATGSTIYQLKVILTGIYPEIWRRLLVSGNTTLSTLHEVLQTAMGWTNSHVHRFSVAGACYADPRLEDDWAGLGAEDESANTISATTGSTKFWSRTSCLRIRHSCCQFV